MYTSSFKRYQKQRLRISSTFNERDHRSGNIIQHDVYEILMGSQERIEQETEKKDLQTFTVPTTAFDWIKQLVCDFCPDLKFGWLVPRLESQTVPQTIVVHNHYVNVLEAPERMGDSDFIELRAFTGYDRRDFSMMGLLEAEPCTKEDVNRAMKNIQEKRLKAKDIAHYLYFSGKVDA